MKTTYSIISPICLMFLVILTSCSGYVEKDGKVYHKWFHGGNWTTEYTLIEEADPETFTTIKVWLNIDLGKDKNHVYMHSSIIKQADPQTFVQVKKYYWKDKNHAFTLNRGGTECIIKNADPHSFIAINGHSWSKDKNYVFYVFDILLDANPNEFEVIDGDWGRDKSHYYHRNQRLDSLDYKSAEIISPHYIRDKDDLFFRNILVKDADPRTFVPDGAGFFGHDHKYMFVHEENKGPITEKYRETYIDKK